MLTYNQEDLDYIYIRAKKNSRWTSLSLNQITDKQFVDWITQKFKFKIKDAQDQVGKPWTKQQKVNVLNHVSDVIGKPCVVMIKRDKRKE